MDHASRVVSFMDANWFIVLWVKSMVSNPGFALWSKAKNASLPFQLRQMTSMNHEYPRLEITKHRGREEGRNETNEKQWQGEDAAFVASDTSLAGKTTKRTIQQSTNVGASSRIGHGPNQPHDNTTSTYDH